MIGLPRSIDAIKYKKIKISFTLWKNIECLKVFKGGGGGEPQKRKNGRQISACPMKILGMPNNKKVVRPCLTNILKSWAISNSTLMSTCLLKLNNFNFKTVTCCVFSTVILSAVESI